MNVLEVLADLRQEQERVEAEREALGMIVDGYERLLRIRGGVPSVTLVEDARPVALIEAPKAERPVGDEPPAAPAVRKERSAPSTDRPAAQLSRHLPIPDWREGLSMAEQGRLLLAHRREHGLSQMEAATRFGVGQKWIADRELRLPKEERISGRQPRNRFTSTRKAVRAYRPADVRGLYEDQKGGWRGHVTKDGVAHSVHAPTREECLAKLQALKAELGVREAASGMKVCARCGGEKPLAEFGTDVSRTSGHRPTCKACRSTDRGLKPGRPRKPAPTCSVCGGPRSPQSADKCRKCWRSSGEKQKPLIRPKSALSPIRAPKPVASPMAGLSEMARKDDENTAVGPEAAYDRWNVLFDAVAYPVFQDWFIRQPKPTKDLWRDHVDAEKRFATGTRTFIEPNGSVEEALRCYDRWEIGRKQQSLEDFETWFVAKVKELGYVPLVSQWEADFGKRDASGRAPTKNLAEVYAEKVA